MRPFSHQVKFILALAACCASAVSSAGNKSETDPLFDQIEDPSSMLNSQVLNSGADAFGVLMLQSFAPKNEHSEVHRLRILQAQESLERAREFFVYPAEKEAFLEKLREELKVLSQAETVDAEAIGALRVRISRITHTPLLGNPRIIKFAEALTGQSLTGQPLLDSSEPYGEIKAAKAARAATIDEASQKLALAKNAEKLGSLAQTTRVSRVLRILRIGGQSLLVLDLIDRVYIWTELHADPGKMPIGTHAMYLARRLYAQPAVK